MTANKVVMTCMTTKQKFDVENPPVIVLANGRYAYRVKCPWEGKNGKELYAFKFCSAEVYRDYQQRQEQERSRFVASDDEEIDRISRPESPA